MNQAADTTLSDQIDRMIRRLRDADLTLRTDPTDPHACILVRQGSGLSLGAGRVSRALVDAACASGRLRTTGSGRWCLDERSRIAAGHEVVADDACNEQAQPRVNERESPLQWLARRRDPDGMPFLSAATVMAGERLRVDATEASMLPSVTVNWSRLEQTSGSASPRDPAMASERVIAARQRIRAAHRHLGPGLGGFALDVCAFLVPLQVAEHARGWPARSGKVILRLALEQLAGHYGIETEARGPERAQIGGWRTGGRADMAAWL